MRNKLQLLAAIAVAALFSDVCSRQTWRRASALFTIWFAKPTPASPERQAARMAKCRECPIFYAKLQTCGSHLDKDTRDLGCKCHCPTKSAIEDSGCWLDENAPESEYGWKEETRHIQSPNADDIGGS